MALALKVSSSEIWNYITSKCPSFVTRDCNAPFSKIFQKCVFYDLQQHEVRQLISVYRYQSVCLVRHQQVFSENEVFVNYTSPQDIIMFGITSDKWFDCIFNNSSPTHVTCSNCMRECDIGHFSSELNEILLVEFSPGLMCVVRFS